MRSSNEARAYWTAQIALVATWTALEGGKEVFTVDNLRKREDVIIDGLNAIGERDGQDTCTAVLCIANDLGKLRREMVEAGPETDYLYKENPGYRYWKECRRIQADIAAAVWTVETGIPFQGFYETIHDDTMDQVATSAFQDDSGDLRDSLYELAWPGIQWHKGHEIYARDYAMTFLDHYGIRAGSFVEMVSPREYNFTTDRLFVKIPVVEFMRVLRELPADELDATACSLFTSRSGFSSFYSPDVETWGNPVEDWDYNQRYAVMVAWSDYVATGGYMTHDDMERDFASEYTSNWPGETEEALFDSDHPGLKRALRIASYLRDRESRAYRVNPDLARHFRGDDQETAAPAC